MSKEYSGIELLRYSVRLLDSCLETFNQKYSAEELLKIAEMMQKSEWDIYPDAWTARQVKEALKGVVPQWTDEQTPKFTPKSRLRK